MKSVKQSSHRDIAIDQNIRRLLSDIARGKATPNDALDVLTYEKDTELNMPKPENEVAVKIGEKKDVDQNIVNIKECGSDDEPISKILANGIFKRLGNRKDNTTETLSQKMSRKELLWSKVLSPSSKKKNLKRKNANSSDYEFDVDSDLQDILHNTKRNFVIK